MQGLKNLPPSNPFLEDYNNENSKPLHKIIDSVYYCKHFVYNSFYPYRIFAKQVLFCREVVIRAHGYPS
jgi:hypothetical protein